MSLKGDYKGAIKCLHKAFKERNRYQGAVKLVPSIGGLQNRFDVSPLIYIALENKGYVKNRKSRRFSNEWKKPPGEETEEEIKNEIKRIQAYNNRARQIKP